MHPLRAQSGNLPTVSPRVGSGHLSRVEYFYLTQFAGPMLFKKLPTLFLQCIGPVGSGWKRNPRFAPAIPIREVSLLLPNQHEDGHGSLPSPHFAGLAERPFLGRRFDSCVCLFLSNFLRLTNTSYSEKGGITLVNHRNRQWFVPGPKLTKSAIVSQPRAVGD